MSCEKHGDKSHPHIIQDECKGCGRCVDACPKDCLQLSEKMNGKGYVPAEYIGEGCTGCGICFYNCPEPYAIEVYKKDKE
ncbi:MAG: NAD-dependent dihydropyrimidine dehydrogenase PreA subunit [Desulforhopalus sp.]|jgi:NAD-dependent dihydropyrimidine dehydrogenase PreA subunit